MRIGRKEVRVRMKLYKRETYLRKIHDFYHDTGLIKAITGVRRCGKSCLMETIRQELLESGKYIGGGAMPEFDRMSLGIAVSTAYVALNLIPVMIKSGGMLSGTMFWCRRKDFDRIGGFDESLVSLEDMDFAKRLKALGKKYGRKYGTLKKSRVITSSRKFDEFGDWYLLRNRKMTKAIFTGRDRKAADKFYYDVR